MRGLRHKATEYKNDTEYNRQLKEQCIHCINNAITTEITHKLTSEAENTDITSTTVLSVLYGLKTKGLNQPFRIFEGYQKIMLQYKNILTLTFHNHRKSRRAKKRVSRHKVNPKMGFNIVVLNIILENYWLLEKQEMLAQSLTIFRWCTCLKLTVSKNLERSNRG